MARRQVVCRWTLLGRQALVPAALLLSRLCLSIASARCLSRYDAAQVQQHQDGVQQDFEACSCARDYPPPPVASLGGVDNPLLDHRRLDHVKGCPDPHGRI